MKVSPKNVVLLLALTVAVSAHGEGGTSGLRGVNENSRNLLKTDRLCKKLPRCERLGCDENSDTPECKALACEEIPADIACPEITEAARKKATRKKATRKKDRKKARKKAARKKRVASKPKPDPEHPLGKERKEKPEKGSTVRERTEPKHPLGKPKDDKPEEKEQYEQKKPHPEHPLVKEGTPEGDQGEEDHGLDVQGEDEPTRNLLSTKRICKKRAKCAKHGCVENPDTLVCKDLGCDKIPATLATIACPDVPKAAKKKAARKKIKNAKKKIKKVKKKIKKATKPKQEKPEERD